MASSNARPGRARATGSPRRAWPGAGRARAVPRSPPPPVRGARPGARCRSSCRPLPRGRACRPVRGRVGARPPRSPARARGQRHGQEGRLAHGRQHALVAPGQDRRREHRSQDHHADAHQLPDRDGELGRDPAEVGLLGGDAAEEEANRPQGEPEERHRHDRRDGGGEEPPTRATVSAAGPRTTVPRRSAKPRVKGKRERAKISQA